MNVHKWEDLVEKRLCNDQQDRMLNSASGVNGVEPQGTVVGYLREAIGVKM